MGKWERGRCGLRWKFHLALLPAVAMTVLMLAWMDTTHERQAVVAAHRLHAPEAGVGAVAGPVDPSTSPGAVARRGVVIHAVYAVVLLSLIALALNAALSRFVLNPMNLIRADIEKMKRGQWRLTQQPASQDEVGGVVESFQMLGLTVDALAGHMIRAERLATLALLATTTAAHIEPRVERIGAAVSRLHDRRDGAGQAAAEEITTASAEILRFVRGLGRAFDESLSDTCAQRRDPDHPPSMRRRHPSCLNSNTDSFEKPQRRTGAIGSRPSWSDVAGARNVARELLPSHHA